MKYIRASTIAHIVVPAVILLTFSVLGGEAQRAAVDGVTSPIFGPTTVTTLNTGFGDNELHRMDQDVLTTSTVEFAKVRIDSSTTGVEFDTDGDGSATLCGVSNGNDECLLINLDNVGANIIGVGSTTGATSLYFSSISPSAPHYICQLQSPTVDGATTFAVTACLVNLSCTGAETINTITGGALGMTIQLINSDTDCTIADDDAATASNAIDLVGTAANEVGVVNEIITLIYNGTYWVEPGKR